MVSSDEDRERIEEELIESAYKQFSRYGPRKATIEDVTEPVGISTGSFYTFFDSKAKILERILIRERERLYEKLKSELDEATDARDGLERMFTAYANFLEQSEFVQDIFLARPPREIVQTMPDSEMDHRMAFAAELIAELDQLDETEGPNLREIDRMLIIGEMATIQFLVRNRELFEAHDPEFYEAQRDLHIETLARGLTEG